MTDFKDLFSGQSNDYAKFRPTYPKELFRYLSSLSLKHDIAWDCGTGNGQAAVELSPYFKKVIATDPSVAQLDKAVRLPNITYAQERAEDFSSSDKINLITVAQAFHWFNHASFANTVSRISSEDAHLAVWSYAISNITPEVNHAITGLYGGILDGYWEKERSHVEDGYQNIHLPFTEIKAPVFELKAEWTLEHLVGYLSTWSALQSYINKNQSNPLEHEYPRLKKAWGNATTRTVSWPLTLRVWKIS